MKKLIHTADIRVRFNETDALGIVWHGNYIKYFEDAREAFGREFGITYLSVKDAGFSTPIVESQTKHKLPLSYGDVCSVEATYHDTEAAKIVFTFVIRNGKGQEVCTGKTIQVFVDENGDLALTNPEFVVEWKKKMGLIE